jgi:hypothetical protein
LRTEKKIILQVPGQGIAFSSPKFMPAAGMK